MGVCSRLSQTQSTSADLLHIGGNFFDRNEGERGGVVPVGDGNPHGENPMKSTILSVIALAATATFALAADDGSLSSKAMKDQPGTMGGSTANPTAVPDTGAATQKAMKDQPGTMGGSTDMPTAKPDSGSLADKAMKDQPGTK
jgi:hypothetical protein